MRVKSVAIGAKEVKLEFGGDIVVYLTPYTEAETDALAEIGAAHDDDPTRAARVLKFVRERAAAHIVKIVNFEIEEEDGSVTLVEDGAQYLEARKRLPPYFSKFLDECLQHLERISSVTGEEEKN